MHEIKVNNSAYMKSIKPISYEMSLLQGSSFSMFQKQKSYKKVHEVKSILAEIRRK